MKCSCNTYTGARQPLMAHLRVSSRDFIGHRCTNSLYGLMACRLMPSNAIGVTWRARAGCIMTLWILVVYRQHVNILQRYGSSTINAAGLTNLCATFSVSGVHYIRPGNIIQRWQRAKAVPQRLVTKAIYHHARWLYLVRNSRYAG